MNDKWKALRYEERVSEGRELAIEGLKQKYELTDEEAAPIRASASLLPANIRALKSELAAPDKRSLREAARDFSLPLIMAELVDNAIDKFIKQPRTADDTLRVSITFDALMNACVVEDNAGGFHLDELRDFFKPGGTANSPTEESIGSYAWGAKKARSALANSVYLLSHSAGSPICLATIDSEWDTRDDDWDIKVGEQGTNFEPPGGALPEGCTRLIFNDLKPTVDYSSAGLERLRNYLGELYELLLCSHPSCPYRFKFDLRVQNQPVTGRCEYHWTQYNDGQGTDLRPGQYRFEASVTVPYTSVGAPQPIACILEIGIKRDTGPSVDVEQSELFNLEDDWGIDVYGLGARLIQRNVRKPFRISEMVREQAGAKLIKGRLLIIGGSHAIPWDTHKSQVFEYHPTIAAVNEHFGEIIQHWVKLTVRAARLKQAVATFSAHPWDGKWRQEVPKQAQPSPVEGAPQASVAPLAGGPAGAVNAAAPSAGAITTSKPDLPTLGKTQTKAAPRTIKLTLTEKESKLLCAWLKCERSELAEALKRKVLRLAKNEVRVVGVSGLVGTRTFNAVRELIKDPKILAKLQAAGLTSKTGIRKAGDAGLKKAGLDQSQRLAVLESLG